MKTICGATYERCICGNGPSCDGTTHQCYDDRCAGEWTYDHAGEPVPVTTPFGIPVPDSVLIGALRERFANEA